MKYVVTMNGKKYEVEAEYTSTFHMLTREEVASGVSTPVQPVTASAPKTAAPTPAAVAPAPTLRTAATPAPAAAPAAKAIPGSMSVTSLMSGSMLGVKVNVDGKIGTGQTMFVLETMKVENEIVAPVGGTVASINVKTSDAMDTDQVTDTLSQAKEEPTVNLVAIIEGLLKSSKYATMTWQQLVMLVLSFTLVYLATVEQFKPLLLLPISFDIFMSSLPHSGTFGYFYQLDRWYDAGILGVIYTGVKSSFFLCIMFLAVGAMMDFGPLIANPVSLLLGAAVQLGIYCAFVFANATGLFTPQQAVATGIIGGADGPTAIYVANNLAPELVAPIAAVMYSYMVLIPLIQPPITSLLTTDKKRRVKMRRLRKVSKAEKIIFPILVACPVSLLLPDVAPLLCMLMLGNLFRECGVVGRLSGVMQNALYNICTIFLGPSVDATARGELFLRPQTLAVVVMGLAAFSFSTFGDVVFGKVLYTVTSDKIDPLIDSADVPAIPVAAHMSQAVGSKTDRTSFLLMHAMGSNVAGVIGSAVAAGFLLAFSTY